jgi:hypothetical protein
MTAARDRPVIQPVVLVTLDADTAPLAGAVTLALAGRQPHALPFFCSIAFETRVAEPGDLIRRAFEAVTDLGERENALLSGNAIEDRIRVVIAFFLGSPGVESLLAPVIERVHRIGGNFFDQTSVDVHVLSFLPDLARAGVREQRYQDAYRQLCQLDSIGATPASLGARARSSIDYRWLLDCRTHAGAHAGTLEDVLEPAARLVTLLVDGEADVLFSAGQPDSSSLHATALGRHTAYSSFGAATLFHQPEVLVRTLAARAAVEHLGRYGVGGAPALAREAADSNHDTRNGDAGEDAIAAALATWADRCGLRSRFLQPLDPAVAALDPAEDSSVLQRQARFAAKKLDELEHSIVGAARGWLADHGILFAGRVLHAARGVIDDGAHARGDELPVIVTGASLASLRTEQRLALREFLDIDPLIRERDRAADDSADDTAALLAQRRALLDNAVDPDVLHAALERIERERSAALPPPTAPPQPPPPPPPVESSKLKVEREGWRFRIPFRRERATFQIPERPLETILEAEPPPPPAPVKVRPRGWVLAERKRWLDGYERLLEKMRDALNGHTIDLTSAVEYYRAVAAHLEKQLTARSNFRLPVLGHADIDRYADAFLPALREALQPSAGASSLADSYELDPPALSDLGNAVTERFTGFDAALMEAARDALAPVLRETVADVLSANTVVPPRFRPADLVRMMVEASEPLVRPGSVPDVASPESMRWMVAHPEVHTFIANDAEAVAVVAATTPREFETTDGGALTLGAVLHGFPAFAVQKVRELRARAAARGATRSEPWPDLVPLEVARTHHATERIFRTLVVAKALRVITIADHRVTFRDAVVPGDLMDLAHAISYETAHRALEHEIDAEVGAILAHPQGVDRLRQALRQEDLASAEQRIVLEVIADLDAREEQVAPPLEEASSPTYARPHANGESKHDAEGIDTAPAYHANGGET